MLELAEHPLRSRGAPRRDLSDCAPLSALAGDALQRRFRCWRGRSGKRYVFTVHEPFACPVYQDAVIVAAVAAPDEGRRIVGIGETGRLGDALWFDAPLARAPIEDIEYHVHLLAGSRQERMAVIADLAHIPLS